MVIHALEAAETSMSQPSANQQRSLDAFLAEKARFDAMLSELQRMSDDHFGANPDARSGAPLATSSTGTACSRG